MQRVKPEAMAEPKPGRVQALDALRGLAVLGMGMSGMIPYRDMPAWMYHAQEPPPTRQSNQQVFGITWVDLVFPFFLFCLGAAIPIAMGNRLKRGETTGQLVWWTVKRGVALAAFAIVEQHFRPGVSVLDSQSPLPYVLSWIGFGLMLLVWARWPDRVPKRTQQILFWIGAVGGLVFLFLLPYDNPPRPDWSRFNIILMVLANVAVSGGICWLVTRSKPVVRLAIVAVVFATYLCGQDGVGIARWVWDWEPFDWFKYVYHFNYNKYLMIVLPGTFCGEMLLHAWEPYAEGIKTQGWVKVWVGLTGLALPIICCAGLLSRQLLPTFFWAMGLCLACWWMIDATKTIPRAQRDMVAWGSLLLLIGLLFESHNGGIRKDTATASYFFTTAGLAFWAMLALLQVEGQKWWKRFGDFLAGTGMNPMLGYIAISLLVIGLVMATGLDKWLVDLRTEYHYDPWWLVLYAAAQCWIVGRVCMYANKRGFFLRA